MRESCPDCNGFGNGFHCTDFVVNLVGDVNGDVATIAFGPAFLPEIASHFGNIVNFLGENFAIIKN